MKGYIPSGTQLTDESIPINTWSLFLNNYCITIFSATLGRFCLTEQREKQTSGDHLTFELFFSALILQINIKVSGSAGLYVWMVK